MAHPVRLELLDLLAQAPRTVEELAGLASQSVANTSQHLQVLFRAGLVRRDKKGLRVTYRLGGDEVGLRFGALRDVALEHVAEVETAARRFLDAGTDIPIGPDELHARMHEGTAIV